MFYLGDTAQAWGDPMAGSGIVSARQWRGVYALRLHASAAVAVSMFSQRPLPTAISAALLCLSVPVLAAGTQSADIQRADLVRMIKQQAAQIKALRQRVAALEAGQQKTGKTASTARQTRVAQTQQHEQSQQLQQTRTANTTAVAVDWSGGGAGPVFKSGDGVFTLAPVGRIFVDYTNTSGSSYGSRNTWDTDISAAWFGVKGTVGPFGYDLEMDFSGGESRIRYAYLSYGFDVAGNSSRLYVGNVKKYRGVDAASSSKYRPFMWSSAPNRVGSPLTGTYGAGAEWRLWGQNWNYSLSITGDSAGADDTDSVVYLTRGHWNPIKTDNGFLHLGAWYYYEDLGSGVARITSEETVGPGPAQVTSSKIADPDHDNAYGFSLGGVYGDYWLLAEYARRSIDANSASYAQDGFSVGGGWMITGEKPGFGTHSGTFGRVHPSHPVTKGGWGAFELVARYDHFDLGDLPYGGKGRSYSVGLNWYLTRWSRLMFDFSHWYIDNQVGLTGGDWANSIGVRTQLDF